jgi:quercetin dioxygenase-like cupin family protein
MIKRLRVFRPAVAIAATAILLAPEGAWCQDAAAVNPTTVHVKLDNARVRVLEAELPPDAKEQLHSHPACAIYVIAGGKVRNHSADGKTSELELATGETIYREPTTHWAENIGKSTIHLVLVELKTGPQTEASSSNH